MTFFSYGFGKSVSRKQLQVLKREVGPDGLLREVSVWEWVFEDGTVKVCKVFQTYRPAKRQGVTFEGIPGLWAWTGERYSEPWDGSKGLSITL